MPVPSPTFKTPTYSRGASFSRAVSYSRPVRYGMDSSLKLFLDVGKAIGEAALTNLQVNALATFIASCKSAGIWDKIIACYPIIGGTAGWHSLNLKSATNYRMTANGTITNSANGTQGNGINGYWDTNYLWLENGHGLDGHISAYTRDITQTTGASWGMIDAGSVVIADVFINILDGSDSLLEFAWNGEGNSITFDDLGGFYQVSGDGNAGDIFKNGVNQIGVNGFLIAPSGVTLFFMAENFGGTMVNPDSRQYQFFSFGKKMEPNECEDFYTAVFLLQLSLGRE